MNEEIKSTEEQVTDDATERVAAEERAAYFKFLDMYEIVKKEVTDKENLLNCILEAIELNTTSNGGLVEHIKRKIKILQDGPKEVEEEEETVRLKMTPQTETAALFLDKEKGLIDKEGNVVMDLEKSLKALGLAGVVNIEDMIGRMNKEEKK